ncbi:MAG: hypothetical protein GY866_27405 [Proteobacteria bacterium]|nr:hypothetical protein [Pseudomonadota bacterium]
MKYGYYQGCSHDSAAGYKESTDAVNRKLGIEFVELRGWNCCGATAMFSLDQDDALFLVGRIFALANSQGLEEIVTVCNSCYATLRKAGKIFQTRPDGIERINDRLAREGLKLEKAVPIRHYLEILCNDVPIDAWPKTPSVDLSSIRVAPYYGCLLTRPWEDVDHPEQPLMLDDLLKRLGFSVVHHSAKTLCCGASHAVPYAKECGLLIQRIVGEVANQGGNTICTICPMCQFNLDSFQSDIRSSALPVPYFSQLVGIALGIEPNLLGLNKLLIPLNTIMNR